MTENSVADLPPFEAGLILGLLIGEVHFGGDRRQPHVVLRMHAKHKALFDWIHQRLPMGKLYGPYTYVYKSDDKPRTFYQLMFRGDALREGLLPLLDAYDWGAIAPEIYARYQKMLAKYPNHFTRQASDD